MTGLQKILQWIAKGYMLYKCFIHHPNLVNQNSWYHVQGKGEGNENFCKAIKPASSVAVAHRATLSHSVSHSNTTSKVATKCFRAWGSTSNDNYNRSQTPKEHCTSVNSS